MEYEELHDDETSLPKKTIMKDFAKMGIYYIQKIKLLYKEGVVRDLGGRGVLSDSMSS